MLKLQLWSTKVILGHPNPSEQIKVEPSIAMVKDLLADNMDGHVIYFVGEAAIFFDRKTVREPPTV